MHGTRRTSRGLRRAAAAVPALGALFVAGTVVESRAYTLRRFELPVLPASTRPLRVLHLSDLHLTPWQRRERAWVRDLEDLEPDLVIDTGDNLAHAAAVPAVLDALGPLLERPGAFVLGSNDYFAPRPKNPARYLARDHGRRVVGTRLPTSDLVRGLTDAGWTDLGNARAHIEVRGVRLALAGVDDPHLGYDRFPQPCVNDAATDLRIGVLHAPYSRVLDAMVDDGAGLILAGHTHGGQLRVPGYGALVTNCDLDRRRARGVSRWWSGAARSGRRIPPPDDAAWLHVSAGLGTSPYTPFRFACRPEASLLTLVPA
jgi:predicted MPP superfamily phosphohydrolase